MMDTREAITATPPQHAQPVVALVLQPMAQMAPPDMGGRAYNSDSQTLGPLTEAAVAAQGRLRTQATGQEAQQGMGAKVAIPCHYDMFEFNTATPVEFTAAAQKVGQGWCILQCGERWSSSRE